MKKGFRKHSTKERTTGIKQEKNRLKVIYLIEQGNLAVKEMLKFYIKKRTENRFLNFIFEILTECSKHCIAIKK